MDEHKPSKAALESAVLSFEAGFNYLAVEKALFDVRRLNIHATTFYRRFNANEIKCDADNIYFEYTHEQLLADQPSHRVKIIEDI